jgi:glycosyltransferase involved in cell wall biosynthesis
MSSVDVVVPCYRYGHFLRECVVSILSQSLRNVRVLIIDDASPDNAAQVAAGLVSEDPRVSFVRHRQNKGHIATYNEGIEWASADYMLLLSADDYLLPGALARAASLMEAHPEVGFVFGNVVQLRDGGAKIPIRRTIKAAGAADSHIFQGIEFIELNGAKNLVETCTAVVRTKLQKRLGGYRHELPQTGDIEMWMRFAAHAPVGFLSAYQAVYRLHGANMSAAYYYYAENGELVFTVNGRLADLAAQKAAFNCFLDACNDVLPGRERLRRRLFRSLGAKAVGFASAAFNEGEMEASKQLAEFAVEVCPHIRRSVEWLRLACKWRMGRRAWQVLRPAVAGLRGEPLDRP